MKGFTSKGFTSKGFTLLELLFVVCIIGILATYAVPGMVATVVQSSVKEGMAVADIVRVNTTSTLINGGECEHKLVQGVGGRNLSKVERVYNPDNNKCVVTMEFKNEDSTPELLRGKVAVWNIDMEEPDLIWSCTSSLPNLYRPRGCVFNGG